MSIEKQAKMVALPESRKADEGVRQELYARHQRIYPREVHGVIATWRWITLFATLGVYYVLPWINWGAGRQAFLVDLPNRKFNLFAWTFWPQDLFYLSALLIISALALFLFTAIAGRLWCGFACPQTVWTEAFLWIERRIEGDRPKQMKLAQGPWNREKIAKKGSKHAAWILFSLWTGFTFVGYFSPIRELAAHLTQWQLGPWETFWMFFYGFATYGNAGWMREQVCLHMCPYARFQSAMFDKDTLIISYDAERGEARGARARSVDRAAAHLGDCIDCTLCVQVCPTGIDIRNGLQYQCIACGSCVDVCNTVMDKMNYPRGLVRFTTLHQLEHKQPHVIRPRILVYAALIAGVSVALVVSVFMRVPLQLDVIRDRGVMFREVMGGAIENVYTLKVMNMDSRAHEFQVSATGLPGIEVHSDRARFMALPGQVTDVPVALRAPVASIRERSQEISVHLKAVDDADLEVTEESRFLGPARKR